MVEVQASDAELLAQLRALDLTTIPSREYLPNLVENFHQGRRYVLNDRSVVCDMTVPAEIRVPDRARAFQGSECWLTSADGKIMNEVTEE